MKTGYTPPLSPPSPVSLYIHWPFCRAKCPYCDFNSHVRTSYDEEAWCTTLLKELDYWHQWFVINKEESVPPLHSIFFGGGTPSLMAPSTVATILNRVHTLFPMKSGKNEGDLEITLEANPNSVEAQNFKGLRAAGVNRVSIGVQALDHHGLQVLGRLHDVKEAINAIDVALEHFPRVSFDLIYGRPDQTLTQWETELERALGFGTTHLSLYQLTIEPGTAFHHRYHQGSLILPPQDVLADMLEATQDITLAAGIPSYEVSNHARIASQAFNNSHNKGLDKSGNKEGWINKNYQCRHNLAYWRYQDFIGVGPGAHGRLTRQRLNTENPQDSLLVSQKIATVNKKSPEAWLKHVHATGCGLESVNPLTTKTVVEEQIMMGLRLKEGISTQNLPHQWQTYLHQDHLSDFYHQGILIEEDGILRPSPHGWQCLNRVLEKLIKKDHLS